MSFREDERFICPADVLSRVLDGEAVILNLESGKYFGLNEVASCVWERLVKGATVGELVAAVLEEFDVTEEVARRDLYALLEELLSRGLVGRE